MSLLEKYVNIQYGNHIFQITEKTSVYHDEILYTTLQIGEYSQYCINVFINYKNTIPSSARMTDYVYDEEIVGENVLQNMIRILLAYIKENYPTITEIEYNDMSSVDCDTDVEHTTYLKPLALYNLSIAYNGQTWYEHYFGARQKNKEKQTKYRDCVQIIFHDKASKSIKFNEFIQIALVPSYLWDELIEYYRSAETYSDFFHSIPESERCRLLRPWIDVFMRHYLEDVFSNSEWIIPLTVKTHCDQKSTFYVPEQILLYTVYQNDIGVSMDDL
jgi:hypothetical protein